MTSQFIELNLARYIGTRTHMIVPNVAWGLRFLYELDLLIVYTSGFAREIEIKTSFSDFKAERKKRAFAHKDKRIQYFYFAIPKELESKILPLVSEKAGLFTVDEFGRVNLVKLPKKNKYAIKLTSDEMIKLGKLASMRIWNLKSRIQGLKRKYCTNNLTNEE